KPGLQVEGLVPVHRHDREDSVRCDGRNRGRPLTQADGEPALRSSAPALAVWRSWLKSGSKFHAKANNTRHRSASCGQRIAGWIFRYGQCPGATHTKRVAAA